MLTLYGKRESGNVYRVRLLLAQLGIAHRRIDVAQFRGEPATREFRGINPIGNGPVTLGGGTLAFRPFSISMTPVTLTM